jgi:hypothetical protein
LAHQSEQTKLTLELFKEQQSEMMQCHISFAKVLWLNDDQIREAKKLGVSDAEARKLVVSLKEMRNVQK